jgi:hypothetical protein
LRSATIIDEETLVAEQHAALRAAFAELPPHCQQLLSMLFADPPRSYSEIHATLGIAVGSVVGWTGSSGRTPRHLDAAGNRTEYGGRGIMISAGRGSSAENSLTIGVSPCLSRPPG